MTWGKHIEYEHRIWTTMFEDVEILCAYFFLRNMIYKLLFFHICVRFSRVYTIYIYIHMFGTVYIMGMLNVRGWDQCVVLNAEIAVISPATPTIAIDSIDYIWNQWETVLQDAFLVRFPIRGWGLIDSLRLGSIIFDDDQDYSRLH